MPLFSIIIPTHNRAQLLKKALDSALEQEWADWELIVVDDGSEDNTKAVVNAYTDDRIQYCYQVHAERSSARNRGIQMAKGQYLCFLDDDDYFLPKHLSILQQHIAQHNFPIAVFRTGMRIDSGRERRYSKHFNEQEHSHPIPFFLKNMVGMHTLCFHQQCLQKQQFDERWWHFQDTHLLIRVLLDFPFYQINAYTCVYVRHAAMGSAHAFLGKDAQARMENNLAAIRDLFEQGGKRMQQLMPSGMLDYMLSEKYLGYAMGNLRVQNLPLSVQLFKKSLQHGKWHQGLKKKGLYLLRYTRARIQKALHQGSGE
ncbi:MAG: glycosyltransferase family 2 protein [Bacteroidota bacterium]